MMKRIIGLAAGGLTVAAVVLLGVIGTSTENGDSTTAGSGSEAPISVVIEQNSLTTDPDTSGSVEIEPAAAAPQGNVSDGAASATDSEPSQAQSAPRSTGSGETSLNVQQGTEQTAVSIPSSQSVEQVTTPTETPEATEPNQTGEAAQVEPSGATQTAVIETSRMPDAAEVPSETAVSEETTSTEASASLVQREASASGAQPAASDSTAATAQVETPAPRYQSETQEPTLRQPDQVEQPDTAPQIALTAPALQATEVQTPALKAPALQAPADQTLAEQTLALANPTRETESPRESAETQTVPEEEAELPPKPHEQTQSSDPNAPAFDVVRVDRDGQTVIAGRAAPDEQVEVLLDGEVVGEARADRAGQFVAVVFANLTDSAQRLELRATLPVEQPTEKSDPKESEPEISDIAPSVQSDLQALAAPDASGDSTDLTSAGSVDTTSVQRDDATAGLTSQILSPSPNAVTAPDAADPVTDRQYAVSNPVIILPSSSPDAAPTLVQPQREQLALLQPGYRDIAGVVLDSITYDDSGAVILSGRGIPGRSIRIYANGREQGVVTVSTDGAWRWASSLANPESIKLFRFDEIGSAGEVTSRVETPFEYSRLSPQVVRDRRVVIQQGDALWRIAEQFYGDGIRYSNIYGANSELIRDPDLIYPGQVFTIPELVDAN